MPSFDNELVKELLSVNDARCSIEDLPYCALYIKLTAILYKLMFASFHKCKNQFSRKNRLISLFLCMDQIGSPTCDIAAFSSAPASAAPLRIALK